MESLADTLGRQLDTRMRHGALRHLKEPPAWIDFSSNDYLGLARAASLFENVEKKIRTLPGNLNGATGSRLLTGHSLYTQAVETKLANLFHGDAALIFNSGYAANLGVLSALPQKDDTILYDEYAHACIKDGARLSLAKRFSFKHNNLGDLEAKMKRATGRVFIAVESVYSMDGDQCPLPALTTLAQQHNASIILDEAHSTGVMGKNGMGLAGLLNLDDKIDVRIYTFGKAMGIHGACVVGSSTLIQYLINFARPFIYTTALTPHSIASIDCAFDYLKTNIHLQSLLQEKIECYRNATKELPNKINSHSAIQAVLFPGNENVRQAALTLQQKGFDVRPILSPTVPKGAERLRICLHTFNTEEEIIRLATTLQLLSDY